MAAECHSPEILLAAWVLAGAVTMLGVLSLAEIAILLPQSGGPYNYLNSIYGEKTAFAYGWSSFACIQTASTAAIAYVFAESFGALIEVPNLPEQIASLNLFGVIRPFENFGIKLIAVTLIVMLTYVNCRGVQTGGNVSNLITLIVLTSILAICLVAFFSSVGSSQNLTQEASTYPPLKMSQPLGKLRVMFVTMLASFWAYEGWINVGFVGDEVQNPQRNLPRILIFGVLIITTLYVLVNAAYLYVVPIDQLIAIKSDQNKVVAVEVVRQLLGPIGVWAISILIAVTTIGCTNSTILTSSRIYYAMARDGLFFRSAGHVNPVSKVPTTSLIQFCTWSSILVFSGSFEQLTDMLVFAQFIFYGLVITGVFVLRLKMPQADRPYKAIGYPVVPLLFIMFCIVLVSNTLLEKPRESGLGLFLIALGVPVYYYLRSNDRSQSSSNKFHHDKSFNSSNTNST